MAAFAGLTGMASVKMRPAQAFKGTVLVLAVLASGAVLAHEHAVGITAERMEVMKDMAAGMKALGEMLDGRAPYDAAAARRAALALHESCHTIVDQFPAGPMIITAGLPRRSGSNPEDSRRGWTTCSTWSACS
jgi:cytochrome c556